jgi:hypothetical protein
MTTTLSAEKWDRFFAAIPTELKTEGRIPSLAQIASLRQVGSGGCALLPLLVLFAAQNKKTFRFSQRDLSAHFGLSPHTIAKMRKALSPKVVTTFVKDHYNHGTPHLHWHLSDELRAVCVDGLRSGEYFFFPMWLIRSGAWRALSHVGRAVYLGAGLLSSVQVDGLKSWIISDHLREGVPRADLERAIQFSSSPARDALASSGLRVALTSIKQLASISGQNAESVGRFLKTIRVAEVRSETEGSSCSRIMESLPMWAYPTKRAQGVVIHFRDHITAAAMSGRTDARESCSPGSGLHQQMHEGREALCPF